MNSVSWWVLMAGFFCLGLGAAAQWDARRKLDKSIQYLREATNAYREARLLREDIMAANVKAVVAHIDERIEVKEKNDGT